MRREHLLARIVLALSAAGLVLSLLLLYVHRQLVIGEGSYTSFCNIGDTVNCDAVLASPYATFLRLPVAAWAALTYTSLLALGLVPHSAARLAVLVAAAWAAGFSLVMAAISIAVLGALCLMCTGLYVVNAGLLVAAASHAGARVPPRTTVAAAVLPFVVAVAVGAAAARTSWRDRSVPMSIVELRALYPDFPQWYREQPLAAAALAAPAGPRQHARGPAAAPVTIVEYSDFACQHCARASRDLERLLAIRPAEVRLVFRHFPLDTSCNPAVRSTVHPTACAAAVAAECAGETGKFWEFHDYLFAHQGENNLDRVAARVGVDMDRFRQCMESGRGRVAVERDIASAVALAVDSTPTLFFNGRAVRGALDAPLYEYALVIEQREAAPGARD
jgi:protein-disulfide isomerase